MTNQSTTIPKTVSLTVSLGVSQIAWLNDDLPELNIHSVNETINDIAKIGFRGCEYGGAFPKDASRVKELLQPHQLLLISGWYSGQLVERSLKQEIACVDSQLKLFKACDCPVLIYGECSQTIQNKPHIPLIRKPVLTPSELKQYAIKLNDFAKYCNDLDLPISFHHHMGTYIQNMDELDFILDNAAEVNIVFDTGHYTFAEFIESTPPRSFDKFDKQEFSKEFFKGFSKKIVQTLNHLSSRINHIHLKNIRTQPIQHFNAHEQSFIDAFLGGMFTVPGDMDEGLIDFDPIIALLSDFYQGWIVIEAEQNPRLYPPFDYSKMAFDYTQKQLLDKGFNLV